MTAALGAVALLAAACGEAPGEGDETEAGNSDFNACMVTDQGGIDDNSFNETSWNGIKAAEEAGTIAEDPKVAESSSDTDYAPNVNSLVEEDCGLIVTVGFLLGQATEEAANANPDERFAIVDFQYSDPETFEVYTIDNVKSLLFNTHEAAFMAGYAAASYTKTGVVGTWGGLQIPTVTIFMDGFYDGVMHYNQEKGEDVKVLGWDKETQKGQFVGDFENTGQAKTISENMISQGADVIHPVAGPLAASAAEAAQDAGDVAVIWADTDGVESASQYSDVILTSVLKNMDVAVQDAVETTAEGDFSNESYIGTLENDGVGIAPFHEFDGEVSDETKQELEDIKQQIIDGSLTVESEAAF